MEYHMNLSEDGSYIYLKYKGNIDKKVAFTSTMESHKLAKKHGISCFLVDAVESRNLEKAFDNYEYAYEKFRDAELIKGACVAILVSPDDHSHNFMETLMRNTGRNVTLFRNREKAVRYLQKATIDKNKTDQPAKRSPANF